MVGSILGFSSPSDVNQGPMTIFQDKLVTKNTDKAEDFALPIVLSPRELIFSDLTNQKKTVHTIYNKGLSATQGG